MWGDCINKNHQSKRVSSRYWAEMDRLEDGQFCEAISFLRFQYDNYSIVKNEEIRWIVQ